MRVLIERFNLIKKKEISIYLLELEINFSLKFIKFVFQQANGHLLKEPKAKVRFKFQILYSKFSSLIPLQLQYLRQYNN